MGTHIHPPIWFKSTWRNDAPALEIHCNSAECTAPHHGHLSEAAARELHAALGTAIQALRSETREIGRALATEATSGLPDGKTKGAGE